MPGFLGENGCLPNTWQLATLLTSPYYRWLAHLDLGARSITRVADPSWSIFSYLLDAGGVWVACPKCHGPARVRIELTENRTLPDAAQIVCMGCLHRAVCGCPSNPQELRCYGCGTRRIDRPDPAFDAEAITPHHSRERCRYCRSLKHGRDPYSGQPFFLKGEIGGKELWALNRHHLVDMRIFLGATLRERNPDTGLTLTAMARLPAWTKAASIRPRIVRFLDKLLASADRYGLP